MSEAKNLSDSRNPADFFHRVTAKPPTQCGFRLAVRKRIKQASSTTFCNALQNCVESAVFVQCHSEAPTGAVRISKIYIFLN